MQLDPRPQQLKGTIKEALMELLHEEPDTLRAVLAEALEDIALADAIREGQTTELVDRESVFELLQDPR